MPKITKKKFEAIVNMMNDGIREQVHAELAPCSDTEFLKRYLELDNDFDLVLSTEFGISPYDDIVVSEFEQRAYVSAYNKAHYARIHLSVPKDKKDAWEKRAKSESLSLTKWIIKQVERAADIKS